MKRGLVISILLTMLMLGGCATLEKHQAEIETAGNITIAAAPAITGVNPGIGALVFAAGGLLTAINAALKKKKGTN